MDNLADLEGRKEDHFPGFGFSLLGLRGWGGVPSILRKTSSGLGCLSFCLCESFSDIAKSSDKAIVSSLPENNYKLIAEKLLSITTKVYYENLDDYEYGMPYAEETILKTILREMAKLGLITHQILARVLLFLPKSPEYHGE